MICRTAKDLLRVLENIRSAAAEDRIGKRRFSLAAIRVAADIAIDEYRRANGIGRGKPRRRLKDGTPVKGVAGENGGE